MRELLVLYVLRCRETPRYRKRRREL